MVQGCGLGLVQDMIQWWVSVNMVMKLPARENQELSSSLQKEALMRTSKSFTDMILELNPAPQQHCYANVHDYNWLLLI